MRQKSYSITVPNITPSQIWKIWTDIPNRSAWDDDCEWAKANGPFQNGTIISMKPKDWPKVVTMEIVDCVPYQSFTDYTSFFLAGLYGTHEMHQTEHGLKLTTTIKVVGPLGWLWRKLVANDIVSTLPHQTALLIKLAQS